MEEKGLKIKMEELTTILIWLENQTRFTKGYHPIESDGNSNIRLPGVSLAKRSFAVATWLRNIVAGISG